MAIKNIFGRGIGFGEPSWIVTRGFGYHPSAVGPLSSSLSVSVRIDWNNDGDFLDANEDVSTDTVFPIRTQRGRSVATDEVAGGRGSFTLQDRTGKYSPFNAASPLWPNVLPSRPVEVRVSYDDHIYPFFRGRCSPAAGQWALHTEIPWDMADAFEQWRLGMTRTPIQEDKRTDEIITVILDDIAWPAGARSLESGVRTLTAFTNHNRLPINALQLAATQELGGLFFVDPAGNAVFQNCYHRAAEPVHLTIDKNTDELQPSLRFEDLVDSVRATYPALVQGTTLVPVFTLQQPRRLLAPSGTFDFENNVSGVLGASGYSIQMPSLPPPYPTLVLADNPTAYWEMADVSGTVSTDQLGAHHGAYVNAPTLLGNAVEFNGSTQYMEIPYSAALNGAAFTIEAWVKVTSGVGTARKVISSEAAGLKGFYIEAAAADTWNVGIADVGGAMRVNQGPGLNLNERVHLVATYDGTSLRFYVNAVDMGSLISTFTPNNSAVLRVAAGTPGLGNYFPGAIDNVAVYPVALTLAQIQTHYGTAVVYGYRANSLPDGSGVDKTGLLTFSIGATDSGGGTVNYLAAADLWLTSLTVRGYALQTDGTTPAASATVVSPIVTGQQLNKDFEFNDDADAIQGWVDFRAAVQAGMNPRITVTVHPTSDLMMVKALSADIGKRVRVVDTAAPWQTHISGDYFIEGIGMSIEGPASVVATWTLLSADLVGGSIFRVSGATGGGQDYSAISGTDRIGY